MGDGHQFSRWSGGLGTQGADGHRLQLRLQKIYFVTDSPFVYLSGGLC